MFVCTVKASSIKFFIAILFSAAVLVGIVAFVPSIDTAGETAVAMLDYKGVATVEEQLRFLEELGYKAKNIPVFSDEVQIPQTFDSVYEKYNRIQKAQGLNLEKYKGKTVLRYTYEIKDTKEPTYATLLIYKNRIIGGDITVMGDNGYVRGFQRFHSPEKDFEAEEDGDQGSSDEAVENVSGGAES